MNKDKLNYFKESVSEYIDNYHERLEKFITDFESNKDDFVAKELELLDFVLWDIEHPENTSDGYGHSSLENIEAAYVVINEIGYDKFYYATKGKMMFLEKQLLPTKEVDTKFKKLYSFLSKYGFFGMTKTMALTDHERRKLIELLISNDLPYCIAMLGYLGLFDYLSLNHTKTKKELHKLLARGFDCNERVIKGNINCLLDYSKEDRARYTSHLYKETVKEDFNNLI
jgi:hypothetical protein